MIKVNGMNENYPEKKAIEIVKNLGIEQFITDNKASIIAHLKNFMNKSQNNEIDNKVIDNKKIPESVVFLSEVLPFMSGIVNVGTEPDNFSKAKAKIEKISKSENNGHSPSGSIIYVLSIYVFIYIVERILEDNKDKEYLRKQAKWLCNMPK